MNKLIFASHNKNKASEINALLAPNYSVETLDSIGITEDIPETGKTLEENALIKARYTFEKTGRNCFADDTGLEVEVLNGEPGVYSARYAGPECDANNNMDKLLHNLEDASNRKARFRTVIAYIEEGKEYLFEGIVNGSITKEKVGSEGFGYDPIFMPDEANGMTFAQMPINDKNKISHRGRAIDAFVKFLKK